MTTSTGPATGIRQDRAGRPTDEELTTRILDAGAEMLLEDGLAALNIEQVARAAGCGKTAIYRRFGGKSALVAAIIASRADLGEVPDTGSLREDLLTHALQNQRNQRILVSARGYGIQAILEPEIQQILWGSLFRERRNRGMTIVTRGIARGELPDDADGSVILDTLAGFTMYRQAIRHLQIDERHYLSLIDALLADPPRRLHDDAGEGPRI